MTSAKNLEFEPRAFEDIAYWKRIRPAFARKIARLLKEIEQTPFSGTGKPEALKHKYSGCWSRRIDNEHRLVYRVEGNTIVVL